MRLCRLVCASVRLFTYGVVIFSDDINFALFFFRSMCSYRLNKNYLQKLRNLCKFSHEIISNHGCDRN